jgi:hypothetical protein
LDAALSGKRADAKQEKRHIAAFFVGLTRYLNEKHQASR